MARGDTSERLGIKKAKRAKRLPKNGKVPVGVVRELKKVAPELLLQLQELANDPDAEMSADERLKRSNAAFETFMDVFNQGKKGRKVRAGDELVDKFEKASMRSKKAMVRAELDKVRTEQRTKLGNELARATHACLWADLDRFARIKRSWLAGPKLICSQDDIVPRRRAIIQACKLTMGPGLWPREGAALDPEAGFTQNVDRCAYEAILGVAGSKESKDYFETTSRLRQAQQELFDIANPTESGDKQLCDSMDIALTCMSHAQMASFGLTSMYDLFEFHCEPFIGGMRSMTGVRKFVHTRHGGEDGDQTPSHQWGFGDPAGRVVRGQLLRIIEELLVSVPAVQWRKVQEEFANVLKADNVTDPGRGVLATDGTVQPFLTGAFLMEQFGGELAAEFTSILYRIITSHKEDFQEVSRLVPEDERMPKLPALTTGWADTFANEFPSEWTEELDPADARRELGRCYVQRLLYTACGALWFVHTPICPQIMLSLERTAVDQQDFVTYRTWFGYDEDDDDDDFEALFLIPSQTEETLQVLKTHRQFGLDLASGKAQALSDNARRIMLDANGTALTDQYDATLACGTNYTARAKVACSLVVMWDNKGKIVTAALVAAMVVDAIWNGGQGTIYVITTAVQISRDVVTGAYSGVERLLFAPIRSGGKAVARYFLPERAKKAVDVAEKVLELNEQRKEFGDEALRLFEMPFRGLARIATGGGGAPTPAVTNAAIGVSIGADGSAAATSNYSISDEIPAFVVFDPSTGAFGWVGETAEETLAPAALVDMMNWPVVGATPPSASAQQASGGDILSTVDQLRRVNAVTMLGAVAGASGTQAEPASTESSGTGFHAVDTTALAAVGFAARSGDDQAVEFDGAGYAEVNNIEAMDSADVRALFRSDTEGKRIVLRALDSKLYRYGTFAEVNRPLTRLQSGAIQPQSYTAAAAVNVLDILAPLSATTVSVPPITAAVAQRAPLVPSVFTMPVSHM